MQTTNQKGRPIQNNLISSTLCIYPVPISSVQNMMHGHTKHATVAVKWIKLVNDDHRLVIDPPVQVVRARTPSVQHLLLLVPHESVTQPSTHPKGSWLVCL
jgi:hypothetical protein